MSDFDKMEEMLDDLINDRKSIASQITDAEREVWARLTEDQKEELLGDFCDLPSAGPVTFGTVTIHPKTINKASELRAALSPAPECIVIDSYTESDKSTQE